jgi:uncharacterized protein YqjF (DUF2071 family)
LKAERWIISQEWHDVLFMHHQVSAESLSLHCPFPLDLYQGSAIVSIVPFRMKKIRFPYLPAIPGLSDLWELNLRTYVDVGGIKGVYFFTLDTDSLLGDFIARNFFHLPYQHAKIEAKLTEDHYYFKHQRGPWHLHLEAQMGHGIKSSGFDQWSTERYSLFTRDQNFIYEGRVHHRPWELQSAKILSLQDNFSSLLPEIKLTPDLNVTYCKKIEVRFSPFKKIGRIHD